MIAVRPADMDTVNRFFGRPSPFTLRHAVVAFEGEEVLALAGVFLFGGRQYVFSELRDEALRYRKQILKTAREFMSRLPKGVYYAKANEQLPSAGRFLRYLGFVQDMDLYRIEVT